MFSVPDETGRRVAMDGDWVVASGHPGGFDIDRTPPLRLGRVWNQPKGMLATDCSVASGDSGGPLFDLEGRVRRGHVVADLGRLVAVGAGLVVDRAGVDVRLRERVAESQCAEATQVHRAVGGDTGDGATQGKAAGAC